MAPSSLFLELTVHSLTKAVDDFLQSDQCNEANYAALQELEQDDTKKRMRNEKTSIRARTARGWLYSIGPVYRTFTKCVYHDGHEREDVKAYRTEVFIPQWMKYCSLRVKFNQDGT